MFNSRHAAHQATDVITSASLDPSTRDLLTLNGIETIGGEWADEQELAAMVDVILSEYEAVAVEQNDYETVQAILVLRGHVRELYEGSAWDPDLPYDAETQRIKRERAH